MKACIKVTHAMFLEKDPVNWCSNLMFIFEILKLSITFNQKKYINSVADMVSYTQQFIHQ